MYPSKLDIDQDTSTMRKLLLIKQETVFAPFCGLIGMRGASI